MARQIINVGASPNDGDGNPIRTAFIKCNDNFGELYSRVQVSPPTTLIGSAGDQAGMIAYDSTYFYYCFANYDGSSIIWGQVTDAGNVSATQLLFGTTTVDIPSANANVVFSVNGTTNVAVISSTAVNISGVLSTTGSVTGGNLLTGGLISATSTIVSADNISGANIFTNGVVSATGNVRGGNINTAGLVTATGNVIGGNIITAGVVSATGTITGGFFSGNGAGLTGIVSTANVGAASQLANGTSVLNIPVSDGDIIGNISGTANVLILSNTNLRLNVDVSALGNITGGNLLTSGNVVPGNVQTNGNIVVGNSVTVLRSDPTLTDVIGQLKTLGGIQIGGSGTLGNVTLNPSQGNNSQTNIATGTLATGNIKNINIGTGGVTGSQTNLVVGPSGGPGNLFVQQGTTVAIANTGANALSVTGNVTGGNIRTAGGVSATGTFTGGNVLTGGLISATGNVTGGNVLTGGQISATGNVTGNYLLGNAALVTGLSASSISNGTSNVNVVSSSGNVAVGVGGTSNISVFATTGLFVTGVVSATGNITGNNIVAAANLYYNGNVLVTRTLTVGTRSSPVTIPLTANGSFSVGTRSSGNVTVTTST